MKKSPFLLILLCALTASLHAELVWKPGNELITSSSQITATPPESSQFSVANLIRPESDGVGTNQYIYHTAWTGSNMIGPNEDPFLQFHLGEAKQHIIFSMIGSAWQATYDTPTEVVIMAANLPGTWTQVAHLTNMQDDFTSLHARTLRVTPYRPRNSIYRPEVPRQEDLRQSQAVGRRSVALAGTLPNIRSL